MGSRRTIILACLIITNLLSVSSSSSSLSHDEIHSRSDDGDYSRGRDIFFIPYELRSLGKKEIDTAHWSTAGPFAGIMMGVRMSERQSRLYSRAALNYALRSALIGFISATVTSAAELSLAKEKRAALFGFRNALKHVDRRLLQLIALFLPAIVETLALYVHTLRTVYRMKSMVLGNSRDMHSRFSVEATRHFVLEQLRHTMLGLPRPIRPPLSDNSVSVRGKGAVSFILRVIDTYLISPLWVLKQVWTVLNRYNNALKTVVVLVASKTLPTVIARTYLPFAAVPGWALFNFLNSRRVITECMCFSLGPQMAVDCLNALLDDAKSRQQPSFVGRLAGKTCPRSPRHLAPELKLAILRACAISIVTYSANTPLALIKGDSNRPVHLHRHAALEALLEHCNRQLGYPGKGISNLDSVDCFIYETLPSLRRKDQVTVIKVLALGLVINGKITLKDKIIFGRALRATGASTFNTIDLKKVVSRFQRGNLSVSVIEEVFEDFESERWGRIEDEEEMRQLNDLRKKKTRIRRRTLLRKRVSYLRKRWRRKRRETLRKLAGLKD